jgi:hypothetical protein
MNPEQPEDPLEILELQRLIAEEKERQALLKEKAELEETLMLKAEIAKLKAKKAEKEARKEAREHRRNAQKAELEAELAKQKQILELKQTLPKAIKRDAMRKALDSELLGLKKLALIKSYRKLDEANNAFNEAINNKAPHGELVKLSYQQGVCRKAVSDLEKEIDELEGKMSG